LAIRTGSAADCCSADSSTGLFLVTLSSVVVIRGQPLRLPLMAQRVRPETPLVGQSQTMRRSQWVGTSASGCLIGAAAGGDGTDGSGDDGEVEGKGPVFDVVEVESDGFFLGQVGAAGHLPEAGESGFDEEPAAGVFGVALDFGG
jgi:hypothetical protein